MKFHKSDASIFIPDGLAVENAFCRVTHLGIGAHQDDLEIMAFHGIQKCFTSRELWFGAVVATDGAGSPRAGEYATYSDADMAALRRREQEKASILGNYGALVQLNYTSAEVKDVGTGRLKSDLVKVLKAVRPEVVYTHNPADKHDTHVAVAYTALAALRELEVGRREALSTGLIGVYDSQVEGGKRYDLATPGRRRSNAVYFQSHATDEAEALWFAMDLTPVVLDPKLDVGRYVLGHIDKFRASVEEKIKRYWVVKR
jgi:LmbE family N-acetylglucosaminyl deacetylase